jgi:hypothetical protein
MPVDTPMSDAAGIVVTEMNTPIRVLDRASVSDTSPTSPARVATINENPVRGIDQVGYRTDPQGVGPGLEPGRPDHQ